MIEKIYKNKTILLIVLAILVYWRHGKHGTVTFDKAFFFSALFFIMIICWESMEKGWKYESPMFAAPNYHCSTTMDLKMIGEYIVIRAGGIKTDFVFEGGDGTVIVDTDTCFFGDRILITTTLLQECDIYSLPYNVYLFLKNHPEEFKPPFLYGEQTFFALQDLGKDPAKLENEIKALNNQINFTSDQLLTATHTVERLVSHWKRLVEKKNLFQIFTERGDKNE